MSIFLSKTAEEPYDEITLEDTKDSTATINERETYDTVDTTSTVYLVLLSENKSELRLIVENEPIRGSSLWISKEDPTSWVKQLKFTEGLDTSQYDGDKLVIPIQIKWATINNIHFNKTFNYNATLKIYDVT